ncbi:MAG: major capsid protein, partial [Acidimicrobiales bacterium]
PEQPAARAVAASGRGTPAGRRPAPGHIAPRRQRPAAGGPLPAKTTVTAVGGSPAFTQGQELSNSAELARAMSERLRSMATSTGEKVFVARAVTEFPPARVLRGNDFDGNYSKIEAATAPQALTAAGGLCAPLETLYDVEVVGSTARPIRDALARFQVDRGGIQYRPNSSAATALVGGTGTGVDVWTMAQDEAGTDSKGCYVVDCPAIQEAEIDAIWLCLEFGNITARFDPETTAAHIQEGMIAHARRAENNLLTKLQTGAKTLSGSKVVGATRDVLANLDKAVGYYRNRHRVDTAVSLSFVLPAWVRGLMRADLARQMAAGDWRLALGPAEADIDDWFARRNVAPVWHLDGSVADVTVSTIPIARQTYADAAAGAAIPGFPNQVDGLLFSTGSKLFLDGGTLDLGVIRDSTLNTKNRYRQFTETFEGVADRGVETLRLAMTVQPTGESAGTADTSAIAD